MNVYCVDIHVCIRVLELHLCVQDFLLKNIETFQHLNSFIYHCGIKCDDTTAILSKAIEHHKLV